MSDSNTDSVHLPAIAQTVVDYRAGRLNGRQFEDGLPDGDPGDGQGVWRSFALEIRFAFSDAMQKVLADGAASNDPDALNVWLGTSDSQLAVTLSEISSRYQDGA